MLTYGIWQSSAFICCFTLLVQPQWHVFEVLDSTPFSKHFTGSKQDTHTCLHIHTHYCTPIRHTQTHSICTSEFFPRLWNWNFGRLIRFLTLRWRYLFIYLYKSKAWAERTILKLTIARTHTHAHSQFFSVMLIECTCIGKYIQQIY